MPIAKQDEARPPTVKDPLLQKVVDNQRNRRLINDFLTLASRRAKYQIMRNRLVVIFLALFFIALFAHSWDPQLITHRRGRIFYSLDGFLLLIFLGQAYRCHRQCQS